MSRNIRWTKFHLLIANVTHPTQLYIFRRKVLLPIFPRGCSSGQEREDKTLPTVKQQCHDSFFQRNLPYTLCA